MNERLLQFIWQFQRFNVNALCTTNGEHLLIINAGTLNHNQGPDFRNARVNVGATMLAGHIELHVRTSDWDRHGHTGDQHYNSVILHVVWEHDRTHHFLPVLELRERVPRWMLDRYEELLAADSFIPCSQSLPEVPHIIKENWLQRLTVERLVRKAQQVEQLLLSNTHHWEETCWWMLARNFGVRLNDDAFEAIARSLPVTLLAKHKGQVLQLEALLFGQAGMLGSRFIESYPKMLAKEYRYLKNKYSLKPIFQQMHFLRMRPVNFPGIRLAQLAMLINKSTSLFASLMESQSLTELRALLEVTANDYWHYHYRFDETAEYLPKKTGTGFTDNLIINTVVPLLFARGRHYRSEADRIKALAWLEALAPENNRIIREFSKLGIRACNAADTQAMLELKANYCDNRRCLDCGIGASLLRGVSFG